MNCIDLSKEKSIDIKCQPNFKPKMKVFYDTETKKVYDEHENYLGKGELDDKGHLTITHDPN